MRSFRLPTAALWILDYWGAASSLFAKVGLQSTSNRAVLGNAGKADFTALVSTYSMTGNEICTKQHLLRAPEPLPHFGHEPIVQAGSFLQENPLKPGKQKNPTGAMLRSIFFPGWGQYYNGKYLKALLVFGLEAGFIGAAVYYNQRAHDDQESAEGRAFYADQRNTNYWRTGLVILLSMLDAYVDAHLSDFDESTDLSLRAFPVVDPTSSSIIPEMHVSLKLSF